MEFGILSYPGAQISAVLGLSDLLTVGAQFAEGGHLRISHWQVQPDGSALRIFDSMPEATTRPKVMILPPSLDAPLRGDRARPLADWLCRQHVRGATLASVCAGAFLLAETGLLTKRRVTTHWVYVDQLQQEFPMIKVEADQLLIDDGDIITAGGLMSWTDLGLHLLQRFFGPAVMLKTARFFLIDPPGRAQSYYSSFSPRVQHGDAAILKVQNWLKENAVNDVAVPAMASVAGLEARTFLRRFRRATGMTSSQYCQRLRVARAQELLQEGDLAIDQIAWQVGYTDAGSFRKVFSRQTGLTPGEYRARFHA